MANENVYVGETGAKQLYQRVKGLVSGTIPRVDGAVEGNISVLAGDGSLTDSGISGSSVGNALTKLEGVETGAQVNVIESVEVAGTALVITGKAVNIPDADVSVKGVVRLTSDPASEEENTAATPEAIRRALANFGGFMVVTLDPETRQPDVDNPSTKYIYLTKEDQSVKTDPYTEWIWNESYWEVIGEASVDLSNYYTKSEVDTALGNKVDKVTGKGLSTNDYTDADKGKLDNIESGAEVNLIETVSVAGTALVIESKSVNVPEAGGTTGAWVKGVVSGEDTTRWNSWVSEDRNIPKPILFKYTTDFSKFDTATLIDVSSDGDNVQYSVALENQKQSLSKVDNGLKIDPNGTESHSGTLSYTIPVDVSTASEIVEEIKIIQQPSTDSWAWFGNGIATSERYADRGRGIYMFTPGLDTEWRWANDGSFGGVPTTFRVKEPSNFWLNQEITTRMEWTADGTTKYYWNDELVGTSSGVTLEAYPNLLDVYNNRTMLSWGFTPAAIITGYSIEIS